jgi:hypothetical protein
MKTIWSGVAVFWVIIACVVTGVVLFYSVLLLAFTPTPWNFPGDPPAFELAAIMSAVALIVVLPLAALSVLLEQTPAYVPLGARACSIVCAATLAVALAGVLERHDRRWSEVRNEIRRYGDAIAAAAGDKNRVLTSDEFARFQRQFIPKPVTVLLPGYGTVRLRMAHGIYPYIGVDFSDASHALFNPLTMWCTYSD